MSDLFLKRSAAFSPCRTWRYTLERHWDESLPHILFILLNPSTADAEHDDPTNRRGVDFARRWGYGGVVFCNAFAFRSPEPADLLSATDPIGPENDRYLQQEMARIDGGIIVAAWGNGGTFELRNYRVNRLLKPYLVYCLGKTMMGQPKHILYLPAITSLEVFSEAKRVEEPIRRSS